MSHEVIWYESHGMRLECVREKQQMCLCVCRWQSMTGSVWSEFLTTQLVMVAMRTDGGRWYPNGACMTHKHIHTHTCKRVLIWSSVKGIRKCVISCMLQSCFSVLVGVNVNESASNLAGDKFKLETSNRREDEFKRQRKQSALHPFASFWHQPLSSCKHTQSHINLVILNWFASM